MVEVLKFLVIKVLGIQDHRVFEVSRTLETKGLRFLRAIVSGFQGLGVEYFWHLRVLKLLGFILRYEGV
jgi:hypothetical protein